MTSSLKDRYQEILEDLSKENNYIVIQICRLGVPEERSSIKTACVEWDENTKRIKFFFNKKFADSLNNEELKFVIAHEAVHLLNGHIYLMKEKISQMINSKEKDSEIIKFKQKFNIASDCVVNDSLVNIYGFKKVLDVKSSTKPKIIYGQDYIEKDCHDLTAMEVFYLLKDQPQQTSSKVPEHDWNSFFDKNGKLNEDFINQIEDFFSQNEENPAIKQEQIKHIEELKKQFTKKGRKAGSEKHGLYRSVDNISKVGINWNKLFYEMVEIKKQQNNWNKPNKKLISIYPDVILPSFTPEEEKEDVFIAIDSSASIDHRALDLFVGVVKGISTRFNIKAISFDTACYDYDLKDHKKIKGGGGTNFQIVEDWINNNLKKYPKAIFVLTDGEGTFVQPKHPSKWCWLLYGSASTEYCKNMKNMNIMGLIK